MLIPKVPSPEYVSQFRPISLCSILYKMLTKSLVDRLKCILPKLVAPTQCSFVPGRSITDNVIIVQEVLHFMRRRKMGKGMMVLKLDLGKAYETLSWDFVLNTLKEP